MANPPFNLDVTDPADNAVVSQFPANERTFRDNANSFLGTEHDTNTGYHKFQELTTTQIGSLTTPPTGMFVYDTTLNVLKINTGTSTSPTWTIIGPATGDIKMWPTATAPAGWLNCDGSAVSRTTYSALFGVIGTTFGSGDGSTTFNVPNFQRRAPVGQGGTGTSELGNAVGNTGGEESHTLTSTEMPVHNHTATTTVSGGSLITGENSYAQLGGVSPNFVLTGVAAPTASTTIADAGSGGAHNTIQPSLVVNFVIKT